ncbi:ribosomal protein S8 [Wallemia mellicola]|nr:ribosomal protein S8 [Wallemia mellicola]
MLPHNTCSIIQNASRAAIPKVPLQYTNQNFHLSRLLLDQGFITNVTLGSPSSNNPSTFLPTDEQHRRIWIELKYRSNRPVLNNMSVISKPSKRVWMEKDEVKRWVNGARIKGVSGLKLGEVGYLKTHGYGWLEARDAARRNLSGQAMLCIIYSIFDC